jgi:hypothetical protein
VTAEMLVSLRVQLISRALQGMTMFRAWRSGKGHPAYTSLTKLGRRVMVPAQEPASGGERVGFQPADVPAFALDLAQVDGVASVWLYQPTERDASIWVLLKAADVEPYESLRLSLVSRIEAFAHAHASAMRHLQFVFDYYVRGVGTSLEQEQDFPEGTKRVAA